MYFQKQFVLIAIVALLLATGLIVLGFQFMGGGADSAQKIKEEILSEARGDDPTPRNITLRKTKKYLIIYYQETEEFHMEILAPPTGQTKTELEDAFLTLVGGDKNIACEMNVAIFVSKTVDPFLAGQELKLSFCE